MGLFAWIKGLFRKVDTNQHNILIINNSNKSNTMAKKTFITKVTDPNAQDGVIEFAQNRTLYADQFTELESLKDETRILFNAKSMKDVFAHYQPCKEGIALETEEGGTVYESFNFEQVKDFEDAQLIEKSSLLSEKKAKIDAYNSVIRQLEKNKTLRNILKDEVSKENLKNALNALITELEDAE